MKLLGSSSILASPDIIRTAAYYSDLLGFRRVDYLDAGEPHICLYRDGVEIILLQSAVAAVHPNRELYGYGYDYDYDAYLYTEDFDELQSELLAKGANLVRPLQTTDYRNRELVVEDINGRWLAFGVKVGLQGVK